MPDAQWFAHHARLTLERLRPRIAPVLDALDDSAQQIFLRRLEAHFPRVFHALHKVYGDQYDFFYHLEQILLSVARVYVDRPADLKALDRQREAEPLWFQSERMVGGVYYVDLFAGDLQRLREKLPYLEELGLTYLHLMPLFKCPPEKNDGGYAVSDYRQVDPELGTMAELAALARELRARGISLVLDFVFNHTSYEHRWALAARAGAPEYQDYYYMFDDRTLPDQYERTLREIFPAQDPGSFTYFEDVGKWVWTTFHHYQWDLNYSNPAVFDAMLNEMLFLANQGTEVLRFDAVVFIWKQMGTGCENLPQVHWLIEAFNGLVHIAAPALYFKSEAIVHPDAVNGFIHREKCQLSYNPTMMALLWESLATREIKLLRHSMEKRFAIPDDCTWVNYVRCHDDIGWTFADEDAAELWMNGFDHRQFLNRFYTGRFRGSFARGLPFNYNPENQDMRISGTTASLAGLEQALEMEDDLLIERALRRVELLYSVALSAGGVPLLYLGDEIAMLNDYSYQEDPAKADDSRWVHRPPFDWQDAQKRHDPDTPQGRIFQTLTHLIHIRKQTPLLANGHTRFFDPGSVHVLAYTRHGRLLVLANFSEQEQSVPRRTLRSHWPIPARAQDLVTGETLPIGERVTLAPYRFMWLV